MAQTRNKFLRILALAAVAAVVLALLYGGKVIAAFQHDHVQQQAASGERKVLYWYDAMNPQRHYDKPGKAPDGMDLVPQYAEDDAGGTETGMIKIDPAKQQLIGVRTGTVERQDLTRTVKTTGQ